MESKWPLKSLEELGVQLLDCVHQTPKEQDVGMPYIGIPQMKNGEIDFKASPRIISQEDFLKWTEKVNPSHGDIILSRRCNPGETAFVPQNVQFALGQNLVLLRPDPKKLHPGYLRWVVQSPFWWDEVERYRNPGAVFDSLKCADIPKFLVPEPPRKVQESLNSVLLAISDKITLNRQINQTLEQMAQTLFKSWFVDFDPVIDNALDAGNEIPEPLQARAELRQKMRGSQDFKPLPAEVRVLFPAEFEESELGWVPKGWNVQTFSEISYILNGCAFKSEDYVKEGNFVLRTKNFTKNQVERYTDDVFLPDSFLDSHSQHLCQPYDYHLVMVGASVGNCAIIYPHQLPAFRNQNMWCFRTKKPDLISQSFIKYLLDFVVTKSLGLASGSAREFFRKGDFGDQLVCLGTSEIQIIFRNICESYLTKMGMLCAESKSLIQLRDTLLPKLISGELRLDDLPDEVVTAANE